MKPALALFVASLAVQGLIDLRGHSVYLVYHLGLIVLGAIGVARRATWFELAILIDSWQARQELWGSSVTGLVCVALLAVTLWKDWNVALAIGLTSLLHAVSPVQMPPVGHVGLPLALDSRALALAGLTAALLKPTWRAQALVAMLVVAALVLPSPRILSPQAVACLLPGHIPRLEYRTSTLLTPNWLLVSNNPERVRRSGIVCQVTLPPGTGRLFVSHFGGPLHLLLHAIESTHLALGRSAAVRAAWTDPTGTRAGLDLWNRYRNSAPGQELLLQPGQTLTKTLPGTGDGLMMIDVQADHALQCTVQVGEATDVLRKAGTQARGLFGPPDSDLRATFSMDGGPQRLLLDGPWLRRFDSVLDGNYGAIRHIHVRVAAGRTKRLRVLLVPRGGPCVAEAGGAVVLFDGRVEQDFDYSNDFTLPANAYSPVELVFLPN